MLLYRYSHDHHPGDVNGLSIPHWFTIAAAAAAQPQTPAPSPMPSPSPMPGYPQY